MFPSPLDETSLNIFTAPCLHSPQLQLGPGRIAKTQGGKGADQLGASLELRAFGEFLGQLATLPRGGNTTCAPLRRCGGVEVVERCGGVFGLKGV